MNFRGGGVVKVDNERGFITELLEVVPELETLDREMVTQLYFEDMDVEIFISSSDNSSFNIDVSSNKKDKLLNLLYKFSDACHRHNAVGFITMSAIETPLLETTIYDSNG